LVIFNNQDSISVLLIPTNINNPLHFFNCYPEKGLDCSSEVLINIIERTVMKGTEAIATYLENNSNPETIIDKEFVSEKVSISDQKIISEQTKLELTETNDELETIIEELRIL